MIALKPLTSPTCLQNPHKLKMWPPLSDMEGVWNIKNDLKNAITWREWGLL